MELVCIDGYFLNFSFKARTEYFLPSTLHDYRISALLLSHETNVENSYTQPIPQAYWAALLKYIPNYHCAYIMKGGHPTSSSIIPWMLMSSV